MSEERRRVGGGPYREVELTTRRPWRRPSRAARIAATTLLAAFVGKGTVATDHPRPVASDAAAWSIAAAHARTLAGGAQVSILLGEGRDARVVRLPGRAVRRGTDVVREPEVLPAPDAVALTRSGAWAIAADGQFFELPTTAHPPRRLPRAFAGHGRVADVSEYGEARLEDGATASADEAGAWTISAAHGSLADRVQVGGGRLELRANGDVDYVMREQRRSLVGDTFAASASRVSDPVEMAVGPLDRTICVRGRGGEVRCGDLGPAWEVIGRPELVAQPLVGLTPAAQIAFGASGLYVVGLDGRLLRAPMLGLFSRSRSPTPWVFSAVPGLGAVTAVGLSHEVDCARDRAGSVSCWGDGLRAHGVTRRDVPVAIAGLDAVERLVATEDYVCALQRGTVSCLGGRVGAPRALPVSGVTELAAARSNLCVVGAGGALHCWDDDPFAHSERAPTGIPGVGVHALVAAEEEIFALDGRSRAWAASTRRSCFGGWADGFDFWRTPFFDGYERIVEGELTCAARGGRLSCPARRRDLTSPRWRQWRESTRAVFARTAGNGEPFLSSVHQEARFGNSEYDDFGDTFRALVGSDAVVAHGDSPHSCRRARDGRVACLWHFDGRPPPDSSAVSPAPESERPALVPGLVDAVELAVTSDGLACARRATGAVVCWGHNAGGVLTPATGDATVLYRLDGLIARAARGGGTR